MLVKLDYETIIDRYSKSVNSLIDDLLAELNRIEKNDPDPERTSAHMVDRKIREWFKRSGGLGY